MSDFLNSFLSAWEDESAGPAEPDDSRAPNVNVLLRKARGKLQGTLPPAELEAEIDALQVITERSLDALEGLSLDGQLEPALSELQRFADLLDELRDCGDEIQFESLRERIVECGERMLAEQARLAVESRRAEDRAPVLQEDAVPVSPEVSRLYRLTQEVVAGGPLEPWEACLAGLQTSFRAALAQARATRGGPVEELMAGLETVLDGLDGIAAFAGERDTRHLDDGWATLLEGFRILQQAVT